MKKLDSIKEDIGYLKLLLGIILATFISLIGWFNINLKKIDMSLFYISFSAIMVLGMACLYLNIKIRRGINAIEEL